MQIEQGLVSNEYVDLTNIMPNSFNENDIDKLLKSETSIKELIQSSGGELLSNTFVISRELQEKIEKKLNQICIESAEKVERWWYFVLSNFRFRNRRDVHRKCMLLFFKGILP